MQAPLSPYLASLSPALLLSASIKQLKHSLLCKQRWIGRGFMELRVTECARRGRAGAAVRVLLHPSDFCFSSWQRNRSCA